jgi:hypothetical protein
MGRTCSSIADAAVWVDESYAPRWAYLNIVIPKGNLVLPIDDPASTLPLLKPVSYVKFRVACQPDSFTTGQTFHVDRAVFRESVDKPGVFLVRVILMTTLLLSRISNSLCSHSC